MCLTACTDDVSNTFGDGIKEDSKLGSKNQKNIYTKTIYIVWPCETDRFAF